MLRPEDRPLCSDDFSSLTKLASRSLMASAWDCWASRALWSSASLSVSARCDSSSSRSLSWSCLCSWAARASAAAARFLSPSSSSTPVEHHGKIQPVLFAVEKALKYRRFSE